MSERMASTKMQASKDESSIEPDVHTIPDGKNKKTSLIKRLKNHEYRNKVMHTMYLGLTFIALGLAVGQFGPTFLDLQIITGTDLEQASAFFTSASIGYLTGSFTAGAIYNKVNTNLLICGGAFAMGIVSSVTAYCKPYALMIFIRVLGGCSAGFLDTAGNSEQMRIWGTEGQSLMQFLHFAFAFGGVISPLYTAPFLAQKPDDQGINTTSSNATSFIRIVNDNNVTGMIMANNDTNVTSVSTNVTSVPPIFALETNVHYAFLITGIFSFLSGIPFFFLCVRDMTSKRAERSMAEVKVAQRKLPLPLFLFTLFNLCLFYIVYCCVEDTFASFLMTFLVRQYDVSKAKGAYITAIYWASFATSRFGMIFLSKFLSAVRMLYLCSTLMAIAFTSFVISAVAGSITAISVFAAMAGLSMSSVFPSGMLWAESELFKVSGPISSCILISASMGTMINPLILGYLMEELSNMWFCYLLVGQTFMLCAVFIFLLNFNRCYINKRYGCVHSSTLESTINVEEQESQQPLSEVPAARSVENGSV